MLAAFNASESMKKDVDVVHAAMRNSSYWQVYDHNYVWIQDSLKCKRRILNEEFVKEHVIEVGRVSKREICGKFQTFKTQS